MGQLSTLPRRDITLLDLPAQVVDNSVDNFGLRTTFQGKGPHLRSVREELSTAVHGSFEFSTAQQIRATPRDLRLWQMSTDPQVPTTTSVPSDLLIQNNSNRDRGQDRRCRAAPPAPCGPHRL